MSKVYEIITCKIIEKLEAGTVPWRQPWVNGLAVNWKTQRSYRGVNQLILETGEYATFKQVQEAGGKVIKGAKGHAVVFWKWIEVEKENENGKLEKENIPLLRYYKVFEINSQVEGLKSKRVERIAQDPVEEAEGVVKGYK